MFTILVCLVYICYKAHKESPGTVLTFVIIMASAMAGIAAVVFVPCGIVRLFGELFGYEGAKAAGVVMIIAVIAAAIFGLVKLAEHNEREKLLPTYTRIYREQLSDVVPDDEELEKFLQKKAYYIGLVTVPGWLRPDIINTQTDDWKTPGSYHYWKRDQATVLYAIEGWRLASAQEKAQREVDKILGIEKEEREARMKEKEEKRQRRLQKRNRNNSDPQNDQ